MKILSSCSWQPQIQAWLRMTKCRWHGGPPPTRLFFCLARHHVHCLIVGGCSRKTQLWHYNNLIIQGTGADPVTVLGFEGFTKTTPNTKIYCREIGQNGAPPPTHVWGP